jgi:hypothetical protein
MARLAATCRPATNSFGADWAPLRVPKRERNRRHGYWFTSGLLSRGSSLRQSRKSESPTNGDSLTSEACYRLMLRWFSLFLPFELH